MCALVAAGYMDPGNWATAIEGGAVAGYSLIWAVVAASAAAMAVQWLASRVGAVTGRSLAQLCRDEFPGWVVWPLWLCAEVAIIACDVAETIGAAVALRLLLHIPLWAGVVIAGVAVVGYFAIGDARGGRLGRVMAVSMVAVAACLGAQLWVARPDWSAVASGFHPTLVTPSGDNLSWLIAAIIGATIMPHNLFLHSELLKQQVRAAPSLSLPRLLKISDVNTYACLTVAMLVNVGLMLLAAAAFRGRPHLVGDLAAAQAQLAPALGATWPGLLFAAALLCCGINSMVSGTLAGQSIAEGFLDLKMSGLSRSIVTRCAALVPALIFVQVWGSGRSTSLLVVSQVVLSFSLPLAMAPLVLFATRSRMMHAYCLGRWTGAGFVVLCAMIVAVNVAVGAETFLGP